MRIGSGPTLTTSLGWVALTVCVLIAGLNSVASVAERPAPDLDAPVPTAKPGTALYHAQMCAQYLGPIPRASCSDAQVVPVTVDGVEVPWTKDRPSRSFEQPKTCDLPDALSGGCQLGNGIARYQGTHHDGSAREEVIYLAFCRDSGLGLIGHNQTTGATCFFHYEPVHSNMAIHPGSNDPDYEAHWQEPAIMAADQCQGCHQADPFIHTPWVDQLKDPRNPDQTLVPILAGPANPRPPYFVLGEEFSQPISAELPDNVCTTCHRPSCDNRFTMPLGDLNMPPPFRDYHRTDVWAEDREALRTWCEQASPDRY